MHSDFIFLFPEMLILFSSILIQAIGLFIPRNKDVLVITSVFAIIAAFVSCYSMIGIEKLIFDKSFSVSNSTIIAKLFILLFLLFSILIYSFLCKQNENSIRSEQITLFFLSTLGLFVGISARNLLVLFCGLELQALCGYSLSAFRKSHLTYEAAVKYLVIGILISCISLLGMSFVYGFTGGSLGFEEISYHFSQDNSNTNLGIITGIVLILIGIFFKVSAAPIHIWTPDVYEGAPISVVSFFATAQKISSLVILVNIITLVVWDFTPITNSLISTAAILSMLVGSLGAIMQNSLKRLMAYSSILNIGYALIGIGIHHENGIISAILYILIYSFAVIGFFAILSKIFGTKIENITFNSINCISVNRKWTAIAISIIMFSMIGIPPFAGFFTKYYIFYQALQQGEFMLAIVGVITSVIAAFYYLKVIKHIYFIKDQGQLDCVDTLSDSVSNKYGIYFVIYSSLFVTVCFAFIANIYLDSLL